MFQIDTTIHLSDIVMVGGGIVAFLRAFLWQRDINRDVLRILRGEDGTNGLVSDMKKVKHDVYERGGVVSTIAHSLNTLYVGLQAKGIVGHDER